MKLLAELLVDMLTRYLVNMLVKSLESKLAESLENCCQVSGRQQMGMPGERFAMPGERFGPATGEPVSQVISELVG